MNAATIFGSRQNQSNILGRRERERERETMKNNGGERYFYLKKGKKFLRGCVPREIETRREFTSLSLSLSLSPCQIFNYGRSVQRYAAA